MESQKRQLETALLSSGWRIAERETGTSDWWAEEIWTIESTWRPVGFTLFLTFLVDPQSDLQKVRKDVWAISCSSTRPQSHGDAMQAVKICIRPSWEKNFPGFVSNLKETRDRATQ